jgi:hypothetical protein
MIPVGFVVYNSVEDVENFRKYTESIVDHFDSEVLAEHYLNGLIDWNGHSIDGDESDYEF